MLRIFFSSCCHANGRVQVRRKVKSHGSCLVPSTGDLPCKRVAYRPRLQSCAKLGRPQKTATYIADKSPNVNTTTSSSPLSTSPALHPKTGSSTPVLPQPWSSPPSNHQDWPRRTGILPITSPQRIPKLGHCMVDNGVQLPEEPRLRFSSHHAFGR